MAQMPSSAGIFVMLEALNAVAVPELSRARLSHRT